MRYAQVVNKVVKNVALWNDAPPSSQFILCPDDVSVNWTYINSIWTAPAEEPRVTPTVPIEDQAVIEARNAAKLAIFNGLKDNTATMEQIELLLGSSGDQAL